MKFDHSKTPDGIFLSCTYWTLQWANVSWERIYNSKNVPLYAMTKMKGFLIQMAVSQLFKINNLKFRILITMKRLYSKNLSISPFLVPHREEFSETVGFKINPTNHFIYSRY